MALQSSSVDDLQVIKERARKLIAESESDAEALKKGADLLRMAEEIEHLRREGAGKRALGYVKELAPWAAVFATLFGLFYQARQDRKEKAEARWEQAFDAVANGLAKPADVIEFSKGISFKEHRDDWRAAAKQFLGNGPQNLETFKQIFNTLYPDASTDNLDDWRDIDLNLAVTYNAVPGRRDAVNSELAWITTKIAPAIRLRSGTDMDLSNLVLYDGDLSGVDLSRANLWEFEPERMNMSDAVLNVSGSSYIPAKWSHTAWWQASSISKPFLERLEAVAHFDGKYFKSLGYGAGVNTSKDDYCKETRRLGLPDGPPTCPSSKK